MVIVAGSQKVLIPEHPPHDEFEIDNAHPASEFYVMALSSRDPSVVSKATYDCMFGDEP